MKITSQIFLSYLKCNTKCWLYYLGKIGQGNAYAEWVRNRNDAHCKGGIKRLFEGLSQKECDSPFPHGDLKTARWQLAGGLLIESGLGEGKSRGARNLLKRSHMEMASQENPATSRGERVVLAANIQAVERFVSKRGRRAIEYIPMRFDYRNKLNNDDKLLLGFDALTLSEALGRNVSSGKIIRGDDYTISKVKTSALLGKVRKRIEKIVTLLRNPSPPDLVLNRNCVECEFKHECHQKAVEKDDLSLLQGMTPKEREMNHKKGIFTVFQLSYTFRPRRRPRWLRVKNEKHHYSLRALAIRENKVHVVGNFELKIEGTPICLDVEALPDKGFYYLIGIRIRNRNSTSQYSLWADSINEEEAIWRDFLGILASVDNPVLVHYGGFETIFLRSMTRRYGTPSEGSNAAKALKSVVNLLSVIFGQVYFPCYSNGLKDIGKFIGFKWSEPNVSGIQTIMWRETWHNSREDTLKQKLVTYNSEDCEALLRVMDVLSNVSNRNLEPSGRSENDFVRADSLPSASPFRFRKIQFVLPELEEINSAAYWDYQREHLILKPKKSTKKTARRVTKGKKVQFHPNKVIPISPPSQCPVCGKTKIYKHQAYAKEVLDLKLQKSGIKRWNTRYLYCRYRCPACNAIFWGSERPWNRSEKFGGNLQALSIYLNIGLRIPGLG